MTRLQQIILAVNSFSTGILLPVLSLILLEKGASLQTLPLLLAFFSITVLCLELPSGILADMVGRKSVFLISLVQYIISFSLLIVTDKFFWLITAILFFGSGRAFSSGSLDALIIDQAIDLHGEGCLSKVTSRLAVLEGAGLAAGSIFGGLIADFTGHYTGNIVLRLLLTVILLILCLVFIEEHQPGEIKQMKRTKRQTGLIELIQQSKKLFSDTPMLELIFIGVFFTGFLLFSIETYWQPAFKDISIAADNTWLLGFISFIGFMAVVCGNTIVQKFLKRSDKLWWNVYNVCRILMSVFIIVFAFQKRTAGFILIFSGIYLFLGGGNVAESTLINKYTPNHMRASVLSLNSFMTQIGGLCASLFSSVMILRLKISGVWIAAGGLLGAYILGIFIITNLKQKKGQNKPDSIDPPGI